mgnify:FL=1
MGQKCQQFFWNSYRKSGNILQLSTFFSQKFLNILYDMFRVASLKNEADVNLDIASSIWCSGSVLSCGFKGVFIQQCLSFTCFCSHLAFILVQSCWVQLKAKHCWIKTSLVGLISSMRAEGRRMIFPQSLVISALFVFVILSDCCTLSLRFALYIHNDAFWQDLVQLQ